MGHASETKRKCLKILGILFLAVLLASTALLLLSLWDSQHGTFPEQPGGEDDSFVRYDGKEYVLKDNLETVLVMGLDKFESALDNSAYNNDQQADFLLLLVIDHDRQSCTALHVNRDTMAEMNILGVAGQKVGTVQKQIALAHTYGNGTEVSCHNTTDAVSKLLLNHKIHHYISLTMDTVPMLNDLVGGVEVTVLDDFTGIDDTLVKDQTVTLMGEHALHYVRNRYGLEDSSNNRRMERQRQYIKALYEKMQQCAENDETFVSETSVQLSDSLTSDYTVVQLQTLSEKLASYDFADIRVLEGESVVGKEFMEFYPDEDSVKKTVIDLFYTPKT